MITGELQSIWGIIYAKELLIRYMPSAMCSGPASRWENVVANATASMTMLQNSILLKQLGFVVGNTIKYGVYYSKVLAGNSFYVDFHLKMFYCLNASLCRLSFRG